MTLVTTTGGFEMNLNQLPLCLLCAALGAGLVKLTDRLLPDETVTAKRVVVTNDEGKTMIQLDAAGVQVLGDTDGSNTLIKAGDKPQINFTREGTTVMNVGESSLTSNVGVRLFHNGSVCSSLSVSDDSAMLLVAPPGSKVPSLDEFETFAQKEHTLAAVIAEAGGNVKVGVKKESKEKLLSLPD